MQEVALSVALAGPAFIGVGMLAGMALAPRHHMASFGILGVVAGVNVWNLCVQFLICLAR
jgi:hypothetical protein